MTYIEGHAWDQALLLPASVEDCVGTDNPVRFIDAFVDDLDLGVAGFMQARPKATGRPGYDPADMLKLHLYGYPMRSSRRLAAEAARKSLTDRWRSWQHYRDNRVQLLPSTLAPYVPMRPR